jgi:hypothetical protein
MLVLAGLAASMHSTLRAIEPAGAACIITHPVEHSPPANMPLANVACACSPCAAGLMAQPSGSMALAIPIKEEPQLHLSLP